MPKRKVTGEIEVAPNEDPERISGPNHGENLQRDAFVVLMSSGKSSSITTDAEKSGLKKTSDSPNERHPVLFQSRDALVLYTRSPRAYPATRVIAFDDNFVLINDLYPKSQIHLLLLPRDPEKQTMHPFNALSGQDEAFCSLVKAETAKYRRLAASELRRRFGKYSKLEMSRDAALDGNNADSDAKASPGKDWEAAIMCGVHANPSMNHLHFHIISRDMQSQSMRHKKHYNSFNTPFLVPIEDFPLSEDDPRRRPGEMGYLGIDMKCWRCGSNFGNKFSKLKDHLADEFLAWKEE